MTIDWKRIWTRINNGDCMLPLDQNCPHAEIDPENETMQCWQCWGQYIEQLVLEEHNKNKMDLTWLGIKS